MSEETINETSNDVQDQGSAPVTAEPTSAGDVASYVREEDFQIVVKAIDALAGKIDNAHSEIARLNRELNAVCDQHGLNMPLEQGERTKFATASKLNPQVDDAA